MIEAHIMDGDLALVKSQPTAENGEIVVALVNDEATIKRFFTRGNTIRLEPANPSMHPLIIAAGEAEVTIIGKVVALVRNMEGTLLPLKRQGDQ